MILFDEIEKAHPDVFNVLLQIMDDGRITDSQGRVVNFKNTVIIMTSNIGSRFLMDGVVDGQISSKAREAVMQELRQAFRPEFLNRIDDIVLFKPLSKIEIREIVDLLLTDLNQRLKDRRITIELDDEAEDWIGEQGYDPVYGARPLKRFLQKQIETKLARAIIAGEIHEGEIVKFKVKNDALVMENKKQFQQSLLAKLPLLKAAYLSRLILLIFLTLLLIPEFSHILILLLY